MYIVQLYSFPHNTTEEDMSIIYNARKSFLFFNDQPWEKKNNTAFDVTIGSYDGAEICELVGLYILSKLEDIIPQKQLGIYSIQAPITFVHLFIYVLCIYHLIYTHWYL